MRTGYPLKLKLKSLLMRKLLSFVAALFISGSMFAGGLITNTNASATWVRLPSRNASTGTDAVYFNPAGLMKMENGFHISISNQSIWQNRKITSFYTGPSATEVAPISGVNYGLHQPSVYKGDVKAPLYPSVFAVYKLDKFAFSFGFCPVGGGGGATFKAGLPSFEMGPSDLVPSLAAKAGVTDYKMEVNFKGTSTFLGFQGTISYKVNDWIAIAAGARYVTAKNTYEGYLRNIQLNVAGTWTAAPTVLTGLASQLTSITTIPAKLAPAIAGGAGSLTLAQLVGAGMMTATDKANIEAGLGAIGVPAANIPLMNVNTISSTVTSATPALNAQAASANATATLVSDQSADVVQDGHGITPIFSVNISPSENLNISVKYEMLTKIELTNKTKKDFTVGYSPLGVPLTMFPNGEKIRNDMPATLTVGVDYKVSPKVRASLGFNYYFDKDANYGHSIMGTNGSVALPNDLIIDRNGLSFSGGLEYNITNKILVSGGYIWANKGVDQTYQSDLTYGQSTQTFGFGGAYKITDKILLNLGFGITTYERAERNVSHYFTNSAGVKENLLPKEIYEKDTKMVALGLDFRF